MARGRVIEESVLVDAPPSVVFAILTDPRQHARIDGSGTVRGNIRGPERLTAGSQFGVDMRMFGLPYRIRNRVVEFEPDRLIAWRHFGGHRWRYRLVPQGRGTSVTESFDMTTSPWPARVVIALLGQRRRNRRSIPATLQRLKHAAEADAAEQR
ncbi:dimethyladenosine transferase [Auraticoccus sp. F435]|uniref:Dimethyladenosine transferase n=1 Tax=Auraticoccus cholistanensis TaxID=2656650 RepID=A0A6A9V0G7_9ACTN|nr:SRPBCC family protein [Auraticoccus cholistanensis]MVA75390.1 dimethyladenosine transferase [Auraticoccus cholistanensis]